MKEKLKPCPFCGKAPSINYYAGTTWCNITCENVNCVVTVSIHRFGYQNAIKAWNTRVGCKCDSEKQIADLKAENAVLRAALGKEAVSLFTEELSAEAEDEIRLAAQGVDGRIFCGTH